MSPIRASNQLSPKTKVVDLLFLYNFYFGQISCSHMKFGVSASRIRVKIIQTKKQCISCSALCSSPAIPATVLVGASSTHRLSTILARCAARPYPVAVPSPSFPLPSSSPSSSSRVAQRRARAVVVRRTGQSSPLQLVFLAPQATSPHPAPLQYLPSLD